MEVKIVVEKFEGNGREFHSVFVGDFFIWRWPSRRLAEDMVVNLQLALGGKKVQRINMQKEVIR